MKKIILLALSSLFFGACEKEIEVDLNSSDPKLVVEATLDDQSDLATVHLSRSANFSDPNAFPAVTDATVVIEDNAGNRWDFSQTTPGFYQNANLRGVVGRTYFLKITTADGQKFSAESTLPAPVRLDSLSILEQESFRPGGGDSTTFFVIPRFFDPAGVANQYRFTQKLNGKLDSEIIVRNDNVFDGKQNEQPIFSQNLEIRSGDRLEVAMMNLDRAAYDYFFSLSQSIGSGPNTAATPANPLSNIRGDAEVLGYFAAFSVQKMEVVIP